MFHPWRRLREFPTIDLAWTRIPGVLGATDGEQRIFLHPDQSQVQRRSTLAHELAHIELGHTGGCTGLEEQAAVHLAARWLITLPDLLDALAWTNELEEAAEVLWVDPPTLKARLEVLTEGERDKLSQAARDREGSP